MKTVRGLLARLEELEQVNAKLPDKGVAFENLLASMSAEYDRVRDQVISAEWLGRQSLRTALCIALNAPLPLGAPVRARINEIAEEGGPSGKFAMAILRVADRCEELSRQRVLQ